MRVVFASYDGVIGGPGRSQSIPYVRGLADRGHAFTFLSYEEEAALADAARAGEVREALGDIPWTTLPWRRNPVLDLWSGVRALRKAFRAHDADLVHARGYVPAFLAQRLGLPFLFDMRGFWPDERADGGLWSRDGFGYRAWKRIERRLLGRAKAVVTLTERARDEIRRLELAPADTPIHVIPCCTDLGRFREVPPQDRPPECRGPAPRYVILGATGTWYLRDEMLSLAARALGRRPDAVLHVLTADPAQPLEQALDDLGVDPSRRLVRRVAPAAVPAWISGAEAAILLIRSTWSKGASCPTKLGELLGCGVPLLMNAGIGDCDRLLAHESVGVTVQGDLSEPAVHDVALDALARLHADGRALRARCRAVAEAEFALPGALDRYEAAYAAAGASIR